MKLISLFEKAFSFYHEVLEIVALFLCKHYTITKSTQQHLSK